MSEPRDTEPSKSTEAFQKSLQRGLNGQGNTGAVSPRYKFQSLGHALSKALGSDDEPIDSDAQYPGKRLAIEQLRLYRAFSETEGREPTPEDTEYWKAHNVIFQRYVDSVT